MNKIIEEIISICSSLPEKEATGESIIACIERICRDSDDNDLGQFYSQHRKNTISAMESAVKNIASDCSEENCAVCEANRWCNTYRINEQKKELYSKKHTYVDFFCGAGGLSLGFKNEGFKLSLANDIQQCCIETYTLNHPETPSKHIQCGDINQVINHLEDLKRFAITDVVIGGPPCQGFSMANRQRLIDDPRNHLYKSFIKAVSLLNPSFVVMENVRGILEYKDQIYEDYGNIGYSVSAHLLYAQNFGVPQNRERVIFIANNLGIDNEKIFEQINLKCRELKPTVLNDALFGLPALKAKTVKNQTQLDDPDSGYRICYKECPTNSYLDLINGRRKVRVLTGHKARFNNARDIEIFSRLLPGDRSDDPKIADIMPYTRRNQIFKDKYFKLDGSKVCKTITAHMKFDCNMYIHPTQARGLTPREAARIQSYPDDYFFMGSFTKTYMQIGNSVPPLVSRIIAHTIKEFLEAEI